MWSNGSEGIVLDLRQKRPDEENVKHGSDDDNSSDSGLLRRHLQAAQPTPGMSVAYSHKLPLNCPDCGKSFSHSSSLKRHSRTHSGVRPFICSICSKGFHYKNNLQDHARTHTGEKPFKCPDCGQSFAQSSTLNRHIGTHGKEKTCQVCGKAFVKQSLLQKHLGTHLDKEEHDVSYDDDCPIELTVNSKNDGEVTIKNQTEEMLREFCCVKCGIKFEKVIDFQQHLWTHASEGQALLYELAALNGLLHMVELMKHGPHPPPLQPQTDSNKSNP